MDHLAKYIISRGHNAQAVDLVKKLMDKDPEKRFTMGVALRHKWFTMKLDLANRSVGGNELEDNSPNLIKKSMQRQISRA